VRERDEPGLAQAGQQESHGDARGLGRVVVLDLTLPARAIGDEAIGLREDGDEIGGGREVRLDPVGPQRAQRRLPLLGHATVVVIPLLLLGRHADSALDVRVGDHDEGPGLLMQRFLAEAARVLIRLSRYIDTEPL